MRNINFLFNDVNFLNEIKWKEETRKKMTISDEDKIRKCLRFNNRTFSPLSSFSFFSFLLFFFSFPSFLFFSFETPLHAKMAELPLIMRADGTFVNGNRIPWPFSRVLMITSIRLYGRRNEFLRYPESSILISKITRGSAEIPSAVSSNRLSIVPFRLSRAFPRVFQ